MIDLAVKDEGLFNRVLRGICKMHAQQFAIRFWLALSAMAAAAGCTTQYAEHQRPLAGQPERPQATLAPLAFVRFCVRNEQECRPRGQAGAVVPSDSQTIAAIASVNQSVNARIRPSMVQGDWSINPTTGDCNDYVVSKRHALLARGFPSSALLMNVVKTPSGTGHLVLVVKTITGDLVLDNLNPEIRPAADVPYTWIKRQTAADPWKWEVV
jgi:predicted transglutaminase-like cysteine proteinase